MKAINWRERFNLKWSESKEKVEKLIQVRCNDRHVMSGTEMENARTDLYQSLLRYGRINLRMSVKSL